MKNFAAMQPPRHASKAEQEVHAPPVCGERSVGEQVRRAPHAVNPPSARTLPARKFSWIANGHAYTSPTGSMRQTTRSGATEVQPGQRVSVAGQVEERVAGKHVLAVRDEPVVELALLLRSDVQVVPDVGAAPGRPQPGDPQLRVEPVGDRLEFVELADVVAGHDDRDLEPLKPASLRFCIARSAVSYEPRPRTASLTSAVAPSSEICTST